MNVTSIVRVPGAMLAEYSYAKGPVPAGSGSGLNEEDLQILAERLDIPAESQLWQ
jgi:hypothetical protein